MLLSAPAVHVRCTVEVTHDVEGSARSNLRVHPDRTYPHETQRGHTARWARSPAGYDPAPGIIRWPPLLTASVEAVLGPRYWTAVSMPVLPVVEPRFERLRAVRSDDDVICYDVRPTVSAHAGTGTVGIVDYPLAGP